MDSKTFTYKIPQSIDPDVFGPPTWSALHELVENIPCGSCKSEATSFMIFWHDFKNYELGKKIKDKKNFKLWIDKISSLKNKTLILK